MMGMGGPGSPGEHGKWKAKFRRQDGPEEGSYSPRRMLRVLLAVLAGSGVVKTLPKQATGLPKANLETLLSARSDYAAMYRSLETVDKRAEPKDVDRLASALRFELEQIKLRRPVDAANCAKAQPSGCFITIDPCLSRAGFLVLAMGKADALERVKAELAQLQGGPRPRTTPSLRWSSPRRSARSTPPRWPSCKWTGSPRNPRFAARGR